MKTYFLVALCIAFIAAAPLTYPGPLQTHVGFAPIYALMGDADATARLGPLVVSIAQAIDIAAHALPPSALSAIKPGGFESIDAFKLLDALAMIGGAAGMFWLARAWFGQMAALLSSAVYAMLPYRLMTAYIRGANGETLFWGLLPWIIGALAHLSRRAMATRSEQQHTLIRAGTAAAAIAVSAVLWLALVPRSPDPGQAQAYLFQVFSARWGYGGRGDWLNAVPIQLGIVPAALALIAVVSRPDRLAMMLAGTAAATVALSIVPLANWWPWALLLSEPWQLLGVAGFCLALLAGSLVSRSPELQTLPALAAMLLLVVLGSYAYLEPQGTDYAPTHPALAQYDGLAYIVDVNVPTLRAGATVTTTVLWQDITPFPDDYKVFVHVIDTQDAIWAQRDSQPLNGVRPTQTWQRGEFLRDPYALTIPANAPGGLRIELGLYRADTNERLTTTRGADHLVLGPP